MNGTAFSSCILGIPFLEYDIDLPMGSGTTSSYRKLSDISLILRPIFARPGRTDETEGSENSNSEGEGLVWDLEGIGRGALRLLCVEYWWIRPR
jgi:hypothetical protein